jgi:hypothetical protein
LAERIRYLVLDDKPAEEVDPPLAPQPQPAPVSASRPAGESLGQAGASFGQARTIEMVFRAKLRRPEFKTKLGRLIEAEVVRRRIAEHVRAMEWCSNRLADDHGHGRRARPTGCRLQRSRAFFPPVHPDAVRQVGQTSPQNTQDEAREHLLGLEPELERHFEEQ